MKARMLYLAFLVLLFNSFSYSQFYIGPDVGFKVSGLKGVIQLSENGQVSTGNVADAGKTGFNVGITSGYEVPIVSIYRIDFGLDVSYSSFGYLEAGYNSSAGAGKFGANGLSGGTTNVFSFDILPLHRLVFPTFKVLSPFLGLGLGINWMSTSNVTVGPPSTNAIITGVSTVKIGLLVSYGVVFQITNLIQPFLQFKHFIPFGSETQFTDQYQASGGGGNESYQLSIQDVPGYFNMQAGCRFSF